MSKYTTTSLIEELEKYPEHTMIQTELAFIYKYNDMCDLFRNDCWSENEFLDYCKKNASEVAIFEGSWDTDEISDLNNIMPKYVDDWEKTRVTISKNEYDMLLDIKKKYEELNNTMNVTYNIADLL